MLKAAVDQEDKSEEEKFRELKENARLFYHEIEVPQRIQTILNDILYEKPTDVYGRLSEFFENFQITPKLENIRAEVILDSSGNFAVRGKLYSTVKNHLKVLASTEISLQKEINYRNEPHSVTPPAPATEENTSDMASAEPDSDHHKVCCEVLEDVVNTAVKGISIFKQRNIDKAIRSYIDKAELELYKADEKAKKAEMASLTERVGSRPPSPTSASKGKAGNARKNSGKSVSERKSSKGKKSPDKSNELSTEKKNAELRLKGCSAACLASLSVLKAASSFKNKDPYEIIRKLKTGCRDTKEDMVLPIPIVSVMSAGTSSPGKVNFIKNLLLIGKPQCTVEENVQRISKAYSALNKLLSVKTPASTAPNGAFWSGLDKVDPIFTTVIDAITSGGSMPGQDLFIGIEVDAEEMYVAEKDKYEVQQGQTKTAKDMIDYYNDLVSKYAPTIQMIIDPFRKEDISELLPLSNAISSRCYVVASEMMLHSAHLWKNNSVFADLNIFEVNCCNGLAFSLGGSITCSDVTSVVVKSEQSQNITIIQGSNSEVSEDVIADLAVGVEATFMLVGAPCRGENVMRLNRLVEIEQQLASDPDVKLKYNEEFAIKAIEASGIEEEDQ